MAFFNSITHCGTKVDQCSRVHSSHTKLGRDRCLLAVQLLLFNTAFSRWIFEYGRIIHGCIDWNDKIRSQLLPIHCAVKCVGALLSS